MVKILGYTLYMGSTWWFGYLLIYLPIVTSIANALHKKWRRRNAPRPIPWKVVGPILLVVLTFPLWDVLVTAVRAKPLCEKEAGIKVFKAVQANSVRGPSLTPSLLSHGYKFTESYGPRNQKYRYSMRAGNVSEERIEHFSTRYSFVDQGDIVAARGIRRSSFEIVDETNKEILGEHVRFSIERGWFETVVSGLLGLEFNPLICGRRDYDELIFKTLLPTINEEVKAQ